MMIIDEPGWTEIGKRCSADRRSMWLRINWVSPEAEQTGYVTLERVMSFELCAGREGDDGYVLVDKSNPQFAALLDVMLTAEYAATS